MLHMRPSWLQPNWKWNTYIWPLILAGSSHPLKQVTEHRKHSNEKYPSIFLKKYIVKKACGTEFPFKTVIFTTSSFASAPWKHVKLLQKYHRIENPFNPCHYAKSWRCEDLENIWNTCEKLSFSLFSPQECLWVTLAGKVPMKHFSFGINEMIFNIRLYPLKMCSLKIFRELNNDNS